ncbi:unnamed protein product [Heterobilharzia americana]|nr:unnamed protein product [Heterobilharzia americana]
MSVPNDIALYDLSVKAGVSMDNKVFRKIYELISLGCSPDVIFSMLKYLASVHLNVSSDPVDYNSTYTPTIDRSNEYQYHQMSALKCNDNTLVSSRNLESQQTILTNSSDCDLPFNQQNCETFTILSNKSRGLPPYTSNYNPQ